MHEAGERPPGERPDRLPGSARAHDRARAHSERRAAVKAAAGPVVGYQRWHEIAMLHWEVSPDVLRPLLAPGVELDLFEGRAYVSLTPFTMKGARLRALPQLPFIREFHELNLRTYVRAGGAPGLWFLSLDAASTPAVAIARATLGLPYFRARMGRAARGDAHEFHSVRLPPGPRPATFVASWSVGARIRKPAGSLEDFLAERYALYTRLAGRRVRVRVRHAPWVLHEATPERLEQDVTRAAGFEVPERPLLARFSEGVDVEVLAPELLD